MYALLSLSWGLEKSSMFPVKKNRLGRSVKYFLGNNFLLRNSFMYVLC